MRSILVIAGIIWIILSCGKKEGIKDSKEGVIEYKITYIQSNLESFPPNLLPKTMIMKYKNHMSSNTIEGFMGFFQICNISDTKKKTNTTLLKVLDNKYLYEGKRSEPGCCFHNYENMSIIPTEERKIIAGINCKKALAVFPGNESENFEIYYCDSFNVENPNIINPFQEIDGVLMQFNLNISSIKMNLMAEKVTFGDVPQKEFSIPKGYTPINREKMEEVVFMLLE
ncbi:MAG: hypothetical protein ACLFUC_08005 [Bacteroidales bacterium]